MDNQLLLFDPEPIRQRFMEPLEKKTPAEQARDREQLKTMARSQDPVTSFYAAQNTLKNVKGHKKIVLDAFIARGDRGYTHEELGEAVPIRADTARKRCRDLVDAGLVEDSGEKRRVSSGNLATIWRVTSLGRSHG